MKLTKLQRYTAYCILLAEAENPSTLEHPDFDGEYRQTNESGLCLMWRMIFGTLDLYYYAETLTPELYNNRKHKDWVWAFYNWEERISALKACIKETEPK